MKIKKVACIIGLSFLWSGCVVSKSQSPREHWKNLSSTSSITTAGLASDQALAVFIRDHNSVYGPTVNVFIEGEYLASLQDGA